MPGRAKKKRKRQFLPRHKRRERFLAYLKKRPGTTQYDITHRIGGSLYTDFMAAYVSQGRTMNDARRDARVLCAYTRIRREARRQKIEGHRKKIRDFLAKNPDATSTDMSEARLYNDLEKGYNGRINRPRQELGLEQRMTNSHNNDFYSDLWGDGLEIPSNPEIGEALAAAIMPVLTARELSIAKKYYGIDCSKHALEKIGRKHRITGKRVKQILENNILKKLKYLNNQNAVANAVLPYVGDKKTIYFLQAIPKYVKHRCLPDRLDQLYFGDKYNPIRPLEQAGLETISQFLTAHKKERKIKGFGPIRCNYVLEELQKFGIEPYK